VYDPSQLLSEDEDWMFEGEMMAQARPTNDQ